MLHSTAAKLVRPLARHIDAAEALKASLVTQRLPLPLGPPGRRRERAGRGVPVEYIRTDYWSGELRGWCIGPVEAPSHRTEPYRTRL